MRVEPPVLNILPKVIFEDDKFFVVSKPPYLSVHATGGFYFNSLVGLLHFEMGYNNELHGRIDFILFEIQCNFKMINYILLQFSTDLIS